MTQKKLADFLVTLGFVIFLAGILTVTLLRESPNWSYYENRLLAKTADFNTQTLSDGSFQKSVEPALQDRAAGRNTLLKLSTLADMNIFRRPVVNQVIHSGNMLLGWNPYEMYQPDIIKTQAHNMACQLGQFRDIVEEYGGKFYYVSVPGQYTYFEEDYPKFLNNRKEYTNTELEEFVNACEEYEINLIEMGQILDNIGNPRELYSTTDYHYTFDGAYVTYKAIMERINEDFGNKLTVLEGENLIVKTLPNPYIGSRLRKVFGLIESDEKLKIGLPKNPIEFTRTDNGNENSATVYALPMTDTEPVLYSMYMGGDIGETVIDTGRDNLPSVLIYGDSFTNPIECLMYYSFDEMRTVDLRHYKEMPLSEYVKKYKPDIVVGIRDYEALLSGTFNGNLFDIQN